jgi:hypothetical protein
MLWLSDERSLMSPAHIRDTSTVTSADQAVLNWRLLLFHMVEAA